MSNVVSGSPSLSVALGTNTLFLGMCSLLVNVGARYVVSDITKTQEYIFKLPVVKAIVLFCMCFLVTRDIRTSFVLTFSFFLSLNALFNENSQFNIIPTFIKNKISNVPPQEVQYYQFVKKNSNKAKEGEQAKEREQREETNE